MPHSHDHLTILEKHMVNLEEQVSKFRARLGYWEKWFIDYSALKEEIDELPEHPSPKEELYRIQRDFRGYLLDAKEITEIFGKNEARSLGQIKSVLSRRTDYVEQNLKALQKLVDAEENKLAAASVIARPDPGTDEESGLPITDIVEELDEDGDVTNARLQGSGDASLKVEEALTKAGVGLAEDKAECQRQETEGGEGQGLTCTDCREDASSAHPVSDPTHKASSEDGAQTAPSSSSRKSVKFADGIKAADNMQASPNSGTAGRLERLMRTAKDQEAMEFSKAVIPQDESDEDRTLRRQMLDYSMSEIGPIVAELQLEEGSSDGDDSSWDATEDDDEDEDDLGRTKQSVVTQDYMQRMQELERRLGVQSSFTVQPYKVKQPPPDGGIGRISVGVQPKANNRKIQATADRVASKERKKVRFANKVEIADALDKMSTSEPLALLSMETVTKPIGDVLERSPEPGKSTGAVATPKRTNRFKQERTVSADDRASVPRGPLQVPTAFFGAPKDGPREPITHPGPVGRIIVDTVPERRPSSPPRMPDDLDDIMLYQAASVEYNRLRNQLMQKSGGFMKEMKENEFPVMPPDVEEDGQPRRISRFKAARLAKH